MLLELKKVGTFVANANAAAGNPGRCGSPKNVSFAFEVKLQIHSSDLNDEDFVLDHNLIQAYFTFAYSKEVVIPSCEMIGMMALRHFYNLRPDAITHIEVDIIADTVSHRVVWDKGQDEEPPEIPQSKSSVMNLAKIERDGPVAATS